MDVSSLTLSALNAMDRTAFVAALGDIFEHAPWIAEGAYPARPFASVAALHQAMLAVLAAASDGQASAFLNGHPDLAAPAARPESLTEASAHEQRGLDGLSPEDAARLAAGNARYRGRFGFPFIVCVRRHDRASIFAALERRLGGTQKAERRTALAEIAEITALRLAERVRSHA